MTLPIREPAGQAPVSAAWPSQRDPPAKVAAKPNGNETSSFWGFCSPSSPVRVNRNGECRPAAGSMVPAERSGEKPPVSQPSLIVIGVDFAAGGPPDQETNSYSV